jgi:hypothetical protein
LSGANSGAGAEITAPKKKSHRGHREHRDKKQNSHRGHREHREKKQIGVLTAENAESDEI